MSGANKICCLWIDLSKKENELLLKLIPVFQRNIASKNKAYLFSSRETIIGRLLLLYEMSTKYNLEWNAVLDDINYSSFGKPFFKIFNQTKFSISHSHNIVLVATGSVNIGADCQYIKDINVKYANYYLHVDEKEQMLLINKKLTKYYLSVIWTIKEALIKYMDTGIVLAELININTTKREGLNSYFENTQQFSKRIKENYVTSFVCSKPEKSLKVNFSEFAMNETNYLIDKLEIF